MGNRFITSGDHHRLTYRSLSIIKRTDFLYIFGGKLDAALLSPHHRYKLHLVDPHVPPLSKLDPAELTISLLMLQHFRLSIFVYLKRETSL